jgi:hypothetical protein
MTFAGMVQVPVICPIAPEIVRFRLAAVPVDTDGVGDPEPAVKLTAEPGATRGGWLATIFVAGMVKVTGWVAGVAPVAVTDPVTVPERVSPTIALERAPNVNFWAKLVRVNFCPAAGAAGLREPVIARPVSVSGTVDVPTLSEHVAEYAGVSAPAVVAVAVAATKPTVPARPAPTSARAPPSDAARTVSDRFDLI